MAVLVLFSIRFVNVIVDQSVDRFECHVLCHAGHGDPATLLLHRGFCTNITPSCCIDSLDAARLDAHHYL